MEDKKPTIAFHYIKNNDFKTVFASGLYGGITVNSLINIDFYTDRLVKEEVVSGATNQIQ